MPKGRILLKSISESKKLSRLKTDSARLLYTWLIPHMDVNGNFSADPEVINGRIFTRLGKKIDEISLLLDELANEGLIIRYAVDDDIFLNIPDFEKKQPHLNKEREGKSTIPKPTQEYIESYSRLPHELLRLKYKGNEVKGRELEVEGKVEIQIQKKGEGHSFCFDEIWSLYPNKDGKKAAERSFRASVTTDKDYEDIKTALRNYLGSEKVQKGFIKNGSTWFNNWRDWVDYKPITAGMRTLAAAQNLQNTLERTLGNE